MQIASFLPHYQLVCISFDISSFSLISYGENVYVSSLKRIRLGHETYTFCPDKVYVSLIPIASRMLKAILLPRRNPEHHYEEKSYVTTPPGGFSAVKAVFLSLHNYSFIYDQVTHTPYGTI